MADAKIINYGQQISAGSTAIPDNTSEALDIESAGPDAKDYITIDTTDGGEKLTLSVANAAVAQFDSTDNIVIGKNNAGSITGAGDDNIIIGEGCGTAITTGIRNIAIGLDALTSQSTGNDSVAIGNEAIENSTGSGNVGVGRRAGESVAGGSSCVAIGGFSNVTGGASNQLAFGTDAIAGGANTIQMGGNAIATADIQVAWTVASDERIKDNVRDSKLGLDFINDLKPVTFTKIHPADWPIEILDPSYTRDTEPRKKGDFEFDSTTRHHGLLAQNVKAAALTAGEAFSGHLEKSDGRQGVQYSTLVVPLISAIQELTKKLEDAEARIGFLESADEA